MLITEIAKKLNITPRTIRHYEEIGVIKSKRLENNYRYFNAENKNKLKFLVRARNLGFSLEECKELIKLFDNSKHLVEPPERKPNLQISVVPKEKQMVCGGC